MIQNARFDRRNHKIGIYAGMIFLELQISMYHLDVVLSMVLTSFFKAGDVAHDVSLC